LLHRQIDAGGEQLMRRNEWGEPVEDVDMFGNPAGLTDGSGVINMRNGTFVGTHDYDTIRLPDELGGQWCAVLHSEIVNLPDGRIGRYHTLSHDEIDCISLLNGDGALWVRKVKPAPCQHINYVETLDGAECLDCGEKYEGEEEE